MSNGGPALRYNPGFRGRGTSMDVKTQAVDRVLEALSPALTAELDRLVQETRENLEQEFQFRLEAAIRGAEAMGTSAAQLQLERAVKQAKEKTREQVTAELD